MTWKPDPSFIPIYGSVISVEDSAAQTLHSTQFWATVLLSLRCFSVIDVWLTFRPRHFVALAHF